jgi:thiosulfate/3-mercaptopyruvate sulfurtransferase
MFFALLASLALAGCGSDENTGSSTCQECLATGGSGGAAGGSAATGGAAGSSTGGAAGSATGGAGGVVLVPADVLVDVAWVQAHESASDVQLVDARAQSAYDAGHLPGALHVDVQSLSTTVNGVSNMLADASTVASLLSTAGVDRGKTAVVYGANVDTSATRLFWALDYHGQPELRLLDGGYAGWVAGSGATETGSAAVTPSSYPATGLVDARRVDLGWMLAHYADSGVVLIDARTSQEFAAGHIPGALNVDSQSNLSSGALASTSALTALYANVPADKTVVTYCQSGSRASIAYLALRRLGYPDLRLYDGSWAEWGAQPNTPKE